MPPTLMLEDVAKRLKERTGFTAEVEYPGFIRFNGWALGTANGTCGGDRINPQDCRFETTVPSMKSHYKTVNVRSILGDDD